jgi:hypothetical protein
MIIHNPILTGSFTVNGTDVSSITSSAASITALNSYTASQNILNGTYATTGSNTFRAPQTINSNLIVTGSITAQTLVVQTVSSSVIYSSGSNVFGNNIANTQVFTGSMNLTGSLTVTTIGTELQVTSTGVNLGNALTDSHVISGSLTVNPGGLFVSSSGLVGINNTSPTYKLDIRNDVLATTSLDPITLRLYNNNDGGSAIYFNNGVSGQSKISFGVESTGAGTDDTYLGFSTGPNATLSERMRITSGGNIGIGVTNPAFPLEVYLNSSTAYTSTSRGNVMRLYNPNSSSNIFAGIELGGAGPSNDGLAGINAVVTSAGSAALTFYTRDSSTFGEKMRITSGGNVGIGTSTPSYKLDVVSLGSPSARVRNGDLGGTATLLLETANNFSGTCQTFIQCIGSVGNGTSQLIFGTAGASGDATATERMRISSNGGLTSTCDASNTNSQVFINSSALPYGPWFRFNTDPNNGTNYYWVTSALVSGSETVRAKLLSNGGLANYQSNNTNLSDVRTKKDITPLESYWNKFKDIEIVKFKYKDQTHDDFNIGVIAQQVEEIAPEFIDTDGWGETPEDGIPLKSVYTADLHHTTIKVLQEAMAKIEQLEAKVIELENK